MGEAPTKCTCPHVYDERTGASVRFSADQFCPIHGIKQQPKPHCATCTCGVGSRIVQELGETKCS